MQNIAPTPYDMAAEWFFNTISEPNLSDAVYEAAWNCLNDGLRFNLAAANADVAKARLAQPYVIPPLRSNVIAKAA